MERRMDRRGIERREGDGEERGRMERREEDGSERGGLRGERRMERRGG